MNENMLAIVAIVIFLGELFGGLIWFAVKMYRAMQS